MEILAILGALEKLEVELANLYEWLSEVLADQHQDAAGFFFRMSTQERSHANLVRYGKRLVRQNGTSFQRVEVNLDKIQELIELISRFRGSHSNPSLSEALLFAMKVETNTEDDVHRAAIVESNPELADLVKGLADADHKHFESLKQFAGQHSYVFDVS